MEHNHTKVTWANVVHTTYTVGSALPRRLKESGPFLDGCWLISTLFFLNVSAWSSLQTMCGPRNDAPQGLTACNAVVVPLSLFWTPLLPCSQGLTYAQGCVAYIAYSVVLVAIWCYRWKPPQTSTGRAIYDIESTKTGVFQ